MRKMTLIAILAVVMAAGSVQAQKRPSEVRYEIYIAGHHSGFNTAKYTQSGDVLVVEGEAEIKFLTYDRHFKFRTEVDAKTYTPQYYSFEGMHNGKTWSGTCSVEGSRMEGEITSGDNVWPSSKQLEDDNFFFFENYVTSQQGLVVEAAAASEQPMFRTTLVLPSDYLPNKAGVSLATELEYRDTIKPIYCLRYILQMENADPVTFMWDPDRNIAVYVDYPGTRTEIFLASDFPDKPKVKYAPTEEELEALGKN